MAANPKDPLNELRDDAVRAGKKQFPWGLVTAIIFIICFVLLGFYFFH